MLLAADEVEGEERVKRGRREEAVAAVTLEVGFKNISQLTRRYSYDVNKISIFQTTPLAYHYSHHPIKDVPLFWTSYKHCSLSAEAVDDEGAGGVDAASAAADGEVGEEPPHFVPLVLVQREQQRVRVGAVGGKIGVF